MSDTFHNQMKNLNYSWNQVFSLECFPGPELQLKLSLSRVNWQGPGTHPGHFEAQKEQQNLNSFLDKGITPSFQEQISRELADQLSQFLTEHLTRRQIKDLVSKLSSED